jgi:hypothetical protein
MDILSDECFREKSQIMAMRIYFHKEFEHVVIITDYLDVDYLV